MAQHSRSTSVEVRKVRDHAASGRAVAPARTRRARRNRLNDLSPKEWLRFQKSWFVHNPPPRRGEDLRHPAKFPETLAAEFITFFTKRGQTVLDPMVGVGSTLVACLRTGRDGIGVELSHEYGAMARQAVAQERTELGLGQDDPPHAEVRLGDATRLGWLRLPQVDYCITSPPYWDMLHASGAWTQRERATSGLPRVYSDNPRDLGNIGDYDEFLRRLCRIFEKVHRLLRPGGYLTVIVKNVKKRGRIYPLAWDLAGRLSHIYALKDEKLWCQDNQRLAPYGLGNAWVSNTFHHYCLNFRKESS